MKSFAKYSFRIRLSKHQSLSSLSVASKQSASTFSQTRTRAVPQQTANKKRKSKKSLSTPKKSTVELKYMKRRKEKMSRKI